MSQCFVLVLTRLDDTKELCEAVMRLLPYLNEVQIVMGETRS